MLITGTILEVAPPNYQDNYGNHYQNITLQTQAGPVLGRKASKTPYGVHDINKTVSWECEEKTNSRGPYNKFTTPQDPKYAQPVQPYAGQAAQALPATPQPANSAKDELIVSQVVYKGMIELECAGKLARTEYETRFVDDVKLILHGKDPRNVPDFPGEAAY